MDLRICINERRRNQNATLLQLPVCIKGRKCIYQEFACFSAVSCREHLVCMNLKARNECTYHGVATIEVHT